MSALSTYGLDSKEVITAIINLANKLSEEGAKMMQSGKNIKLAEPYLYRAREVTNLIKKNLTPEFINTKTECNL